MEFIGLEDVGPSRYEALFQCSDCGAVNDEECQPDCLCPECRLKLDEEQNHTGEAQQ